LTLLLLAASLASGTGIREIDFRNFEFKWTTPKLGVPAAWSWLEKPPTAVVRAVNGRHDFSPVEAVTGGYSGGYLMVESVTYGDLNGDGVEDAAVDLLYSTGGTANWHYLYVFTVENGARVLLGRLQSGSRADGGLMKVDIQKETLVLRFADSARRAGDCCSAGYIVARYGWKGGRFVEVGTRESGDLNPVRR
jgi:hypothetical protein